MKGLWSRPTWKYLVSQSGRRSPRLRFIGVITALVLVFGTIGGATSTLLIRTAASPAKTAQVSSTIMFSPATQAELHKLMATPQGRAGLLRALQASFGKEATVGVAPDQASSKISLDATCAPSFSCGISRSGGWHFWIIASYASAQSANLALLQPYCWAALVPETGPVGAGACLTIGAILWELVNNWPRFTNHGIWMAVYWNRIEDGRY